MTAHARSLSQAIASYAGCGERTTQYRILSIHQRACNLLSANEEIIALVHPSLGNGPFHIVLDRPLPFAGLYKDMPVRAEKRTLIFPDFTIDLQTAALWDPTLCACPSLSELPSLFHRPHILPQTDAKNAVTRRSDRASALIDKGLQQGQSPAILQGVGLLAGLGPGLTPAGDDFLLGLMARWWLQPTLLPPGWTVPALCQQLVQTASPRTTRLSGVWLRHAARGQFAQPWHHLARALRPGHELALPDAVNRILSTGATSGADALKGFLYHERETVRSPHLIG
ncbi:MAG: DUF2877 domain-containing protein [Chloroflexi bacterium]|nr:DUF2877 domain-containing protein [Chloroflexota bacterium]